MGGIVNPCRQWGVGRDTQALRQRLLSQSLGHLVKLITRQGLTLETQLEI